MLGHDNVGKNLCYHESLSDSNTCNLSIEGKNKSSQIK